MNQGRRESLNQYESIETHWIAFYVNDNNNAIYFDNFGVEIIPKEISINYLILIKLILI